MYLFEVCLFLSITAKYSHRKYAPMCLCRRVCVCGGGGGGVCVCVCVCVLFIFSSMFHELVFF